MDEIEQKLQWAIDAGWEHRRVIDGEVYGLASMIFTVGLMCKCDQVGYERRYCFESFVECYMALQEWDGTGHPGVRWVKMKGVYNGQPCNHRPDQINEDGTLQELDEWD